MKKIFTLPFFLLSFCAFGQSFYTKQDTIPIGKMDTIKVLLLVSDTSYMPGRAFSILGYSVRVRVKHKDNPGEYCINCENYWQFVCHLNAQKKPINKNYIVWDAK